MLTRASGLPVDVAVAANGTGLSRTEDMEHKANREAETRLFVAFVCQRHGEICIADGAN